MLILSRRSGERLKIGEDIEISVLSIRGQQVRIGIKAPSWIGVHREEIYRRIHTAKPPHEDPPPDSD